MNKQELIDKLASLVGSMEDFKGINAFHDRKYAGLEYALELIKQLDEPQKPVVPQFVAEWFEDNKDALDLAIFMAIRELDDEEWPHKTDFENWLDVAKNKPIETLIRMKDGYEVEKESLYYVPLPDTDKDSEVVYALEKKRDGNIEISLVNRRKLGVSDSTKLSEQEIKSVDERYQLFAKEIAK